jgi:hypothetical protein
MNSARAIGTYFGIRPPRRRAAIGSSRGAPRRSRVVRRIQLPAVLYTAPPDPVASDGVVLAGLIAPGRQVPLLALLRKALPIRSVDWEPIHSGLQPVRMGRSMTGRRRLGKEPEPHGLFDRRVGPELGSPAVPQQLLTLISASAQYTTSRILWPRRRLSSEPGRRRRPF